MDNTFWSFIALIIFIAVVAYFRGFRKMNTALDDRAAQIRREIDEARELKEEAKQQLAEYQRRRREAEEEAKDIISAAKREAEQLRTESHQKNEEFVRRRTEMAEQKIAQAEKDAVAEVRASAVNLAVAAAADLVAQKNAGAQEGRFLDDSIAEVRRRLN